MTDHVSGTDLLLRCHEVIASAQKAISTDLLITLEGVSTATKSYVFKHRFKSPSGLEKKVRRKRHEGARSQRLIDSLPPEAVAEATAAATKALQYSPDHVTDAWGCRFVTLYQDQIPTVVETLLQALELYNRDAPYPVRLREFVVYTNRPLHDPLSIVNHTLAILSRSGFASSVLVDESIIRAPENRKSAYSSVHFVFDRDVDIEHVGKESATETASFEVQIRDIFEEGWGEVQHNLLYSSKDDSAELAGPETEAWAIHLNALKTFVDGCSQHASIIRRNRSRSASGPAPALERESATSRILDQKKLVAALNRSGAPRPVLGLVSKSYTLLLAVESAFYSIDFPDGLELSTDNLLQEAVEAFRNSLSALGKHATASVHEVSDRPVRFFVQMELSNLELLLAEAKNAQGDSFGSAQLHKEAISGFESVLKEFPNDTVARLRLARAITREANTADTRARARSLIEEAIVLLGSDPLTGPKHWMAISARTQLGNLYWQEASDSIPSEDLRASLYRRSIAITKEAVETWNRQTKDGVAEVANRLAAHKALSNVLYYYGDLIIRTTTGTDDDRAELRRCIADFDNFSVPDYREYYRTRDNLMHGWLALGEQDKALALASENFRWLRSEAEGRAGVVLQSDQLKAYLSRSQQRCFDAAVRTISDARDRSALSER